MFDKRTGTFGLTIKGFIDELFYSRYFKDKKCFLRSTFCLEVKKRGVDKL